MRPNRSNAVYATNADKPVLARQEEKRLGYSVGLGTERRAKALGG